MQGLTPPSTWLPGYTQPSSWVQPIYPHSIHSPGIFISCIKVSVNTPTLLQGPGNNPYLHPGSRENSSFLSCPREYHLPPSKFSEDAIPSSMAKENPSLRVGSREYHLSPFRTQGILSPSILGPTQCPSLIQGSRNSTTLHPASRTYLTHAPDYPRPSS